MQNSRRHDVNVRVAIGSTLCGVGRNGIVKLAAALNLPPPVQEQNFREAQEYVLGFVERARQRSMTSAVEEAVLEAGGVRELTVSGDGAWLTRGFSSAHGIAALCSSTKRPKIIDTNWCSKKCSQCQGAESLRHLSPDLHRKFLEKHECQLNYAGNVFETICYMIANTSDVGSSGGMEKIMVHEMFSRSVAKYQTKYVSYIGDGDAKVHKYLIENPPYPNMSVNKREDINHFSKRMLNRIKKIKEENKNTILPDGKKLSGKGRLTDSHAIKFKIYFAKAIRESGTDLEKLYRKSWAIFNHHYSTDQQPMHNWCDRQWCKYLQATWNHEPFRHDPKTAIPKACLDLIRPVFAELCSRDSLARVVGGGSQNANEAFHSVLWTMVPKHRFWSSTILRIALGLSTIIYNDGYGSLESSFSEMFSSVGYYSTESFTRLDDQRRSTASKVKKRRMKIGQASANQTCSSDSDGDIQLNSNTESSIDVSDGLLGLTLSEDDAMSVYEAGGDD